MKFVVLLALVGLASCHTALVGGDRARDVTIEYTYIDDHGKEVTVKVKADKLGLDLSQDESRLSLKKVSSSSPSVSVARSRFAQVEREQEPAVHRFLQVHPQPAPAPLVETKFRSVSAEPVAPRRVAPTFKFVEVEDFEKPDSRFIQVEAPRPKVDNRFVEVEIPRPKARTQFVQFDDPEPKVETRFVKIEVPRPEIETRFVQVETPRPKVETKFIKVEVPEPEFKTHFVQVQSPRQEASTHFVQAKPVHVPSFHVPHAKDAFSAQAHVPVSILSAHRSVSGAKSRQFNSDDNSAEK